MTQYRPMRRGGGKGSKDVPTVRIHVVRINIISLPWRAFKPCVYIVMCSALSGHCQVSPPPTVDTEIQPPLSSHLYDTATALQFSEYEPVRVLNRGIGKKRGTYIHNMYKWQRRRILHRAQMTRPLHTHDSIVYIGSARRYIHSSIELRI